MKAPAGEKQSRIKELDELLRMAQYYLIDNVAFEVFSR